MKMHHFVQRQFLPVSLEEAWEFFSSPHNLDEITPPHLNFRILDITRDGQIYSGQLIRYKIRLFPLIRVTWLTEITAVKPGEYFIDEQRIGPYAMWQHQHHFKQVAGGIEMTDQMTYALPFGVIGELAHRIFVRRALNAIFNHREKALIRRFYRSNESKTIAA